MSIDARVWGMSILDVTFPSQPMFPAGVFLPSREGEYWISEAVEALGALGYVGDMEAAGDAIATAYTKGRGENLIAHQLLRDIYSYIERSTDKIDPSDDLYHIGKMIEQHFGYQVKKKEKAP